MRQCSPGECYSMRRLNEPGARRKHHDVTPAVATDRITSRKHHQIADEKETQLSLAPSAYAKLRVQEEVTVQQPCSGGEIGGVVESSGSAPPNSRCWTPFCKCLQCCTAQNPTLYRRPEESGTSRGSCWGRVRSTAHHINVKFTSSLLPPLLTGTLLWIVIVCALLPLFLKTAHCCYLFPEDARDPCETTYCPYGAECVRSMDGATAACECPKACYSYGDNVGGAEVCGSDGKNYPNMCELNKAACENMKNITMVYEGKCGE